MQDFQKRVIDEKAELDVKREKLGAFKNTEVFARLPWQEQERLNTQAHIMTMYSAVLGERIQAMTHPADNWTADKVKSAIGDFVANDRHVHEAIADRLNLGMRLEVMQAQMKEK